MHICQVGSTGASILPVLHDAVGEWGAFTLRNVTYLTRDLTHEGGGHQHLNKAFSSSNSNHSGNGGSNNKRAVSGNIFAHAAVGDEVQMSDVNSPHHHRVVHDYYDLSFLAQLNEEDKVSFLHTSAPHYTPFFCNVAVSSSGKSGGTTYLRQYCVRSICLSIF